MIENMSKLNLLNFFINEFALKSFHFFFIDVLSGNVDTCFQKRNFALTSPMSNIVISPRKFYHKLGFLITVYLSINATDRLGGYVNIMLSLLQAI
jgi:hypothetical protein